MIELTVDEFKNRRVTFHISKQEAEDYKRLKQKPFLLELSDGFEYTLKTCMYPSFYKEDKELFVRGENEKMDCRILEVSLSEYLIIFELVKKYNEKFF